MRLLQNVLGGSGTAGSFKKDSAPEPIANGNIDRVLRVNGSLTLNGVQLHLFQEGPGHKRLSLREGRKEFRSYDFFKGSYHKENTTYGDYKISIEVKAIYDNEIVLTFDVKKRSPYSEPYPPEPRDPVYSPDVYNESRNARCAGFMTIGGYELVPYNQPGGDITVDIRRNGAPVVTGIPLDAHVETEIEIPGDGKKIRITAHTSNAVFTNLTVHVEDADPS